MPNRFIRNESLLHNLFSDAGVKRLFTVMNGGIGGNSPANFSPSNTIGMFYVSRKYTGPGAAVLTASGITSTNPSWTAQLSAARMGDAQLTYPDPYAALVAAKTAFTAGTLLQAVIIVLEGNMWTVGSDNPAQNGTSAGNQAGTEVADIGMNTTVASDTTTGSLIQDGIFIYFAEASGIRFINKSYAVRLGYNYDGGLGNTGFNSAIIGRGKFIQMYGEHQGFVAQLLYVDNPNAIFRFECHQVNVQQWQPFNLLNFESMAIHIDMMYSTDANTFTLSSTVLPVSGKIPVLNIYLRDVYWGLGQTPDIGPEDLDNWYFFYVQTLYYGMKVTIRIDNIDMITTQDTISALMEVNSYGTSSATLPPHYRIANTEFNFSIGNLYERSRTGSTVTSSFLIMMMVNSVSLTEPVVLNTADNNTFFFQFENANVVSMLGFSWGLVFYGINNYLTMELGNFYRRTGVTNIYPLLMVAIYGTQSINSAMVKIRGNVTVENSYIYHGLDGTYNNLLFEGDYIVKSGTAIPMQITANETVVFKNCTIIAPAGATYSVTASTAKEVLGAGLVTNTALNPVITVKGMAPVVDAAVTDYYS